MYETDAYHFILIEDSQLDAFIGQKIIQSFGSVFLTTEVFLDSKKALSEILSGGVSSHRTVILLDIQMPLMNGFQFIEAFEAQASPEIREQYIISMLSSSINEKDLIKAKSYSSVFSFLHKPLKKEMVQELLESLKLSGKG